MAFCDLLLSRGLFAGFIHDGECVGASFLFMTSTLLCGETTSYLSVHLLMDVGSFHLLAFANSVAVNMQGHMYMP